MKQAWEGSGLSFAGVNPLRPLLTFEPTAIVGEMFRSGLWFVLEVGFPCFMMLGLLK